MCSASAVYMVRGTLQSSQLPYSFASLSRIEGLLLSNSVHNMSCKLELMAMLLLSSFHACAYIYRERTVRLKHVNLQTSIRMPDSFNPKEAIALILCGPLA